MRGCRCLRRDGDTAGAGCPQRGVLGVPPHVPLTSEDSFGLPQRLLQPSLRDPPQPDLGIFTRCGQAGVTPVIRHARCQGTSPAHSPGDSRRTDSEVPRVEGVPGEVGHRHAILDGGHGRVGEPARLGELWERTRGSPARHVTALRRPLHRAVPRGRRSVHRRRAGGGRRAGGWHRSHHSRRAW